MANVLTVPNSGIISFDNRAYSNLTVPPLSTSARIGYDGGGGVNITSYTTATTALDRFSVDGTQGRLFSVTDALTGTLFSVNNITGLPILEVQDSNTVIAGQYNTNAFVLSGTRLGLGTRPLGTNRLSVSGDSTFVGTISTSSHGTSENWQSAYEYVLSAEDTFVTSIKAGDGILINGQQGIEATGNIEIDVNNSVQLIKADSFKGQNGSASGTVTLEDATSVNYFNIPYNSNAQTSFETVSLGSVPPLITLYWQSSGTSPITVFASNSAVSTTVKGQTAPNNQVLATCRDGNILFIGGSFTTIGGVTRNRFAMINLAGGTQHSTLGPIGTLSSFPVWSTGAAQLSSFNGNVNYIQIFQSGANKYLCVGGDFTGANSNNRFCIFDMNSNFQFVGSSGQYNFSDTIYTMVSGGNYLYLGGRFRNVGGFLADGLTRINLAAAPYSIDYYFQGIASDDYVGIYRGGYIGGASPVNYSIYALEFHKNVLYVGGAHVARVFGSPVNTQQKITAHDVDIAAGYIIRNWQPILNGNVTALKMDKTNNILYVGGQFTSYNTLGGTAVTRNRVLALSANNYNGSYNSSSFNPSLFNLWDPNCNSYCNAIELHDETDNNSPVYLGGQFTTVNSSAAAYSVAMTKPQLNTADAILGGWSPSIGAGLEFDHKPGLLRIPETHPLSGILVNGAFTSIGGVPRYYFARINARGQTAAAPISGVQWEVYGSVMGAGSNLAVDTTKFVTLTSQAGATGILNTSELQLTEDIIPSIEKGNFCRFIVRRPQNKQDQYARSVWLLGCSLDYSVTVPVST